MEKTNRRTFLVQLGVVGASPLLVPLFPSLLDSRSESGPASDEEIFRKTAEWAMNTGLFDKPIGDIISTVGQSFLNTPYVAHSLEAPGEERLIVNLRAFDCLTFVESTLALSRCIRSQQTSFEDFRHELQQLRYRDGIVDGYPSRLHYFSEWVRDNERRGNVRNVSKELGGVSYQKNLNFMSTHRSSYAQLEDETVLRNVMATEKEISNYSLQMIPRGAVRGAEPAIKNGDVIALVTSLDGIDVSHTGLGVVSDGRARYLHAPLSGGSVQLSTGSLAEYIQKGPKSLTGIMVVRPLEPPAKDTEK